MRSRRLEPITTISISHLGPKSSANGDRSGCDKSWADLCDQAVWILEKQNLSLSFLLSKKQQYRLSMNNYMFWKEDASLLWTCFDHYRAIIDTSVIWYEYEPQCLSRVHPVYICRHERRHYIGHFTILQYIKTADLLGSNVNRQGSLGLGIIWYFLNILYNTNKSNRYNMVLDMVYILETYISYRMYLHHVSIPVSRMWLENHIPKQKLHYSCSLPSIS